jgi:hypothetical protein
VIIHVFGCEGGVTVQAQPSKESWAGCESCIGLSDASILLNPYKSVTATHNVLMLKKALWLMPKCLKTFVTYYLTPNKFRSEFRGVGGSLFWGTIGAEISLPPLDAGAGASGGRGGGRRRCLGGGCGDEGRLWLWCIGY